MSFENVIGGKLSLKGGALPVVGGIKKKKRKSKTNELARPTSAPMIATRTLDMLLRCR